jgi:hypothetical protein
VKSKEELLKSLRTERKDLASKLAKLEDFILSNPRVDKDELERLRSQQTSMAEYVCILGQRINAARSSSDGDLYYVQAIDDDPMSYLAHTINGQYTFLGIEGPIDYHFQVEFTWDEIQVMKLNKTLHIDWDKAIRKVVRGNESFN